MTRALSLLAKISKNAKEAEGLLERGEDKQVAAEIRYAAETVIAANKYEQRTKRNHQEREGSRD